jgi:presequence protease
MGTRHGFRVLATRNIDEINAQATLYEHEATGAELLSITTEDTNKVFGITFRTTPYDSTGLPHILEHSVLSGSEKYPLKDPFIELARGSLHTFLNAMTYPDKTCYPVASQNLQDFYNLIDVYMDAVLHPRLGEDVFAQEGWHLAMDAPDDALSIVGVVYNEMKGVYSSPDSLLGRIGRRALFPDTTYGNDSGGDPDAIPTLTYEQFRGFHRTYYHPSNARIFFYGDDDPEERLRRMADYLESYEQRDVPSQIDTQPRFQDPQRVTVPYDPGDGENQAKGLITVNWMLQGTDDVQRTLALNMLSHALLGTPGSPLRKALIDSGLGDDLAGEEFVEDLNQQMFSTGMRGVAVENLDKVEALILDTLSRLASDGIPRGALEAAMNSVEFALRENNSGMYPRGLVVMLRSLSTWLYDGDPFAPLAFEEPLAAIKERWASDGRYFEGLIQDMLLDNPHRVTVKLQPDAGALKRREEALRAELARRREGLSPKEVAEVIERTAALKLWQETPDTPEARATIPHLTLNDLDRENQLIPLEESSLEGRPLLYHDLFTNGILYLDLGLNLKAVPLDLLPYVPLFGRCLTEMGTETEDMVTLTQRIGRTTGGVGFGTMVSSMRNSPETQAWFFLRGKAMLDHLEDLLSIMRDVLLTARLDDQERFRQMVAEQRAGAEASLIPSGHAVVNGRLRSHFALSDWASEVMGGLTHLLFLRELQRQIAEDWPAVVAKLEQVRDHLVNRSVTLVNATVDGGSWPQVSSALGDFIRVLPNRGESLASWNMTLPRGSEGLTAPSQVNFVGKGANLYQLGYAYHGSAAVISNYLRTTWLWEQLRIKGGAYGAFCSFNPRSGTLALLSYRDPNLQATLEAYDKTGAFLRAAEIDQSELEKSIIGVIGAMDSFMLPDAKGHASMVRYLLGESDELRQRIREEVLTTTAGHFRDFSDVLDRVAEEGDVVVLGSPDAINAANDAREDKLTIQPVL